MQLQKTSIARIGRIAYEDFVFGNCLRKTHYEMKGVEKDEGVCDELSILKESYAKARLQEVSMIEDPSIPLKSFSVSPLTGFHQGSHHLYEHLGRPYSSALLRSSKLPFIYASLEQCWLPVSALSLLELYGERKGPLLWHIFAEFGDRATIRVDLDCEGYFLFNDSRIGLSLEQIAESFRLLDNLCLNVETPDNDFYLVHVRKDYLNALSNSYPHPENSIYTRYSTPLYTFKPHLSYQDLEDYHRGTLPKAKTRHYVIDHPCILCPFQKTCWNREERAEDFFKPDRLTPMANLIADRRRELYGQKAMLFRQPRHKTKDT